MGFLDAGSEHFLRAFRTCREMLEIVPRSMQHLLRGQRPASVPAHPVGHHGERHASAPGVRHERHAVLLLLAITLMLGDARIYYNRHQLFPLTRIA